jgi:hypothetical protein
LENKKKTEKIHQEESKGLIDDKNGPILSESPVYVALALKLHHHWCEQGWKDCCGRIIHLLIGNPCKQKATQL